MRHQYVLICTDSQRIGAYMHNNDKRIVLTERMTHRDAAGRNRLRMNLHPHCDWLWIVGDGEGIGIREYVSFDDRVAFMKRWGVPKARPGPKIEEKIIRKAEHEQAQNHTG